MKKKPYVFRPYGQDEGSVAFLTEAEADRIQHRIDAIELETDDDPPFYIYEMDLETAKGISEVLDECEAELADDEEEELK